MATSSRVREQHIAVFGESGSGKTVLLSSFFGPSQEGSFHNDLWDLVADDTGQGNRLYQNYLGMRDRSTAPASTRFASATYNFSIKLKDAGTSSARRRPFDALRLAWHDYPGEWFEESPSSEEEERRRVDLFRTLLRSDVALVLVDGQKLRDYEGEEEKYLRSLFTNLRQGLLRLKDDLLGDQERLTEFPRIWIVALSKADLFPDWDVHDFRDLVIRSAAGHLDDLRHTLMSFVETPQAMSIGEDFMLLSSARFRLGDTSDADSLKIDVTQRVGVDAILPVAALLPLERRVQWAEQMELPWRVANSLADGAEAIAAVLVGGFVQALIGRIPRVGPFAAKAALPIMNDAVKLAGSQLRDLNEEARQRKDFLTATLTQFKLDLEEAVAQKLLLRSLK